MRLGWAARINKHFGYGRRPIEEERYAQLLQILV